MNLSSLNSVTAVLTRSRFRSNSCLVASQPRSRSSVPSSESTGVTTARHRTSRSSKRWQRYQDQRQQVGQTLLFRMQVPSLRSMLLRVRKLPGAYRSPRRRIGSTQLHHTTLHLCAGTHRRRQYKPLRERSRFTRDSHYSPGRSRRPDRTQGQHGKSLSPLQSQSFGWSVSLPFS